MGPQPHLSVRLIKRMGGKEEGGGKVRFGGRRGHSQAGARFVVNSRPTAAPLEWNRPILYPLIAYSKGRR